MNAFLKSVDEFNEINIYCLSKNILVMYKFTFLTVLVMLFGLLFSAKPVEHLGPIQKKDNVLPDNSFRLITFTTEDQGKIQGSLFEAGKGRVVLFAHGAVFNKESWYFLCDLLREQGISSLSIDFRGYGESKKGTSDHKYHDILGAIEYLKDQGYKKIAIVGGSMGGGAVLKALAVTIDKKVDKVALLAAAGGKPVMSEKMDKLFVVSRDEGAYQRVMDLHEKSADPKTLKVFPGSSHAQHMFKTEHSQNLVNLILGFVGE